MRRISHGWDAHPGIFCCTWQVLKHREYKSQSTNSCVEELSHLFSLEAKSISIFNLYLDWQVKPLPSLLIGIPTCLSHSWVRPRGQHIGGGGVFRSWAISLCVTWAPVCTTPSDQQCSAVSGPPRHRNHKTGLNARQAADQHWRLHLAGSCALFGLH